MMQVKITITGGTYAGLGTYEGDLSAAPVTTLVPEGIVSARTTEEANRVRDAIARTLAIHPRMTMSSVGWSIAAERVEA